MNPRNLVLMVSLVMGATMEDSHALSISLAGTLASADDIFYETISIGTVSSLEIQSFGYGGGVDANGHVVPSGGFDPVVTLFVGTGNSALLFDSSDDGTCPPGTFDPVTTGCLDSSLHELNVLPGLYTIAISVSPNFAVGPTLGDGFSGGGDFTDVFGDNRAANFAVDVSITPTNPVPEPRIEFLMLAGCVMLWTRRRSARGQLIG